MKCVHQTIVALVVVSILAVTAADAARQTRGLAVSDETHCIPTSCCDCPGESCCIFDSCMCQSDPNGGPFESIGPCTRTCNTPEDPKCFSGSSTVEIQGRGAVAMKDLNVGDAILTNSKNHYQTVYAFGHYNPSGEATFLKIDTDSSSSSIEVTPDHLLYLQGKGNPVRASSIQVGDVLAPFATVKKISEVTSKGLYTPLTPDGRVVVNGIQASSYVALQQEGDEHAKFQGGVPFMSQHTGIHAVLTPFRMLCRVGAYGFCQSYDSDGIPYYISNGIQILKWAEKQSLFFQIVLIVPAFLFFGALVVMEKVVLDTSLQHLVLFLVFAALVLGGKYRETKGWTNG